jgi:gliding motility associated protien GldN
MKIRIVSLIVVLLSLSFFLNDVYAQQKKGKGKKQKAQVEAPPPPAPAAAPPPPPPVVKRVPNNYDSAGYNTLSVRMIHKSDVMYKMSVWRKLDLREKCNLPLFAKDMWMTKFILEGVAAGVLQPYANDSLSEILTKEEFMEKIKEPTDDGGTGPQIDLFTGQEIKVESSVSYYQPKQLYTIVFKEDLIFDKQRSRHYYDIQTVTLYLPAELNVLKGTEVEIATFKYKDLIKLFSTIPTAKWYNTQNRAEDKKLSDAFDLRLFCSRIIKMSNPRDEMLQDIQAYNTSNKALLIASQRLEHELVTKENEVWDY